jgi:hypothetical protein
MTLLALTLAWIQDATPESRRDSEMVMYVRIERSNPAFKILLQREDLNGKDLGAIELKREDLGGRMRATGSGTILASRQGRIVEIDREGKTLRELQAEPGTIVADAHTLADGRWIYAAMGSRRGKGFVAEVDKQGKEVRRFSPEVPGIRSAWPVGNDRVLIAALEGVFEFDWSGTKHFERRGAKGEYCYDVHPLEGGNFLYVGTTPGQGKSGKVAEYDRDGKEIWSGAHGCPTGVQALPNGNVLVAGG